MTTPFDPAAAANPGEPDMAGVPVAERRGAFAAWAGWSWEAVLLRPAGGSSSAADLPAALAALPGVGAVGTDLAAAVPGGSWAPPPGLDWALLATPAVGPGAGGRAWSHLVSPRRDLGASLDRLLGGFGGETLRAGHQDTAGVLYVLRTAPGGTVVNFETDGERWRTGAVDPRGEREVEDEEFDPEEFDPEDDDPFENWTKLSGAAFPPGEANAWLDAQPSPEAAFQTLLADAGAYLPGLAWDGHAGRLTAHEGHEAALDPAHLARIDLVRFGPVDPDEPSPAVVAASRALEAAVNEDDPAGVRAALADGATTGPLPDVRFTALYLACNAAREGRAHDVEIVRTLLDAGADPDEGPPNSGSPLHRVVGGRAEPGVAADLVRLLAAAGANLDGELPRSASTGDRPLHTAAKKGRPHLVRALLEAGADPTAANAAGRTPRADLAHLIERNTRSLGEATAREWYGAEYDEVRALLAAADGGGPDDAEPHGDD